MQEESLSVNLHAISYYEDDFTGAVRTPREMEGKFSRNGEPPVCFLAMFEPMGGIWVWETTPEGKVIQGDKMRDPRFSGVGDMAMSIAFHNSIAIAPEDFKWTYTKKVVEEWS
jgi:hypothetical protein